MDLVVAIAQLVLAAVFVVSAVAKLVDRAGSRRALVDFGLPDALAGPASGLLPVAELAVAVALVAAPWWGALGALGLLGAFTLAIGVNLALGRRPDCHCFGRLSSAPVGWQTVARNVALMGVAALVLSLEGGGGTGLGALVRAASPAARGALVAALVAAPVVGVLGWIVMLLWRQQGRLLLRVEALEHARPAAAGVSAIGLPMGAPAPEFRVKALAGDDRTLASLLDGSRPVLLAFTDPKCGPCTALLPRIAQWQREHAEHLRVVLASRGSVRDNEAKIARHGLADVLLQSDFDVAERYQVPGTPSAVLVTADGRIGSPVASGEPAIAELVAFAAAGGTLPVTRQNGKGGAPSSADRTSRPARPSDRVPSIPLATLDGAPVDLARYVEGEGPTLLVFWNPYCGHCQRMLPDLRALERTPVTDGPRMVFVSVGPAEANRAQDLQSPILLDGEFEAMRRFGVPGTPSAVLVDARGRVASAVAAGAAAVLDLARPRAQAVS